MFLKKQVHGQMSTIPSYLDLPTWSHVEGFCSELWIYFLEVHSFLFKQIGPLPFACHSYPKNVALPIPLCFTVCKNTFPFGRHYPQDNIFSIPDDLVMGRFKIKVNSAVLPLLYCIPLIVFPPSLSTFLLTTQMLLSKNQLPSPLQSMTFWSLMPRLVLGYFLSSLSVCF